MDKCVSIGEEITIDGGLSNNDYICQFLADVLGRKIRVTNLPELTAIGCAQMAGVGLEEIYISGNDGKLFSPKRKIRHDWIEQFSKSVVRTH